jgi:hypothetical protein
MKRYVKPSYENDMVETTDIMTASGMVSVEQNVTSSITNAATSLDDLLSRIEQSIRD